MKKTYLNIEGTEAEIVKMQFTFNGFLITDQVDEADVVIVDEPSKISLYPGKTVAVLMFKPHDRPEGIPVFDVSTEGFGAIRQAMEWVCPLEEQMKKFRP